MGAGAPAVRVVRHVGVSVLAGVAAGAIAAGAGGRLVMRLLAVTSPEESQGADHRGQRGDRGDHPGRHSRVHHVHRSGDRRADRAAARAARGRCCRAGVPAASRSGRCCSSWRATRIDPLRSGNFDFNLTGPDWLSVSAFILLALFQGLVAVAVAARLSGSAPARPLPVPARAVLVGRAALALALAAALPAFVNSVTDVLTAA